MNEEILYGIKYKVIKTDKNKYLLFPISLIKGESDGFDLIENNKAYPILSSKEDLKNRNVIDYVFSYQELKEIYDIEEDEDFLTKYFFEEKKDIIIYVEVDLSLDIIKKTEINLHRIEKTPLGLTCVMDKDIPSILLNQKLLDEIMSCDDIHVVRVLLEKYHNMIGAFQEINRSQKVTKISIENGKVQSVETTKKIAKKTISDKEETSSKESSYTVPTDISYIGLRDAIKEKVFGHDEAIDTFAQKLYMNVTAEPNEPIESILLVGPTGVGKTETVNAACEYLNIPFVHMNASNLVPQGIKGTSIEDVMIALYELAGKDLVKAEHGLIFLDEFDKLNASILDYKLAIKNILLTFNSGGDFPIQTDDYSFIFHSLMTNKIYAGVFERILEKEKKVGFGTNEKQEELLKEEQLLRKKIMEKKYFTLEELSRISTIIGFGELSRDIKKDIILRSKISEFVKKKNRYKRQFGIDLSIEDSYLESILDKVDSSQTGMRIVSNLIKASIDSAEKSILESPNKYKRLVLSKDTVLDNHNYRLD